MKRTLHRAASRAVALLAVLALAACADGPTGPSPNDDLAQLRLTANVSGTPISTLVVEVTAPDITTPLVFNLTVQGGVASGTIKVPPGQARTITVRAFDSSGQVTNQGSVTINVSPGQNPPVTLSLNAAAGHVPITVTIGANSVIVTPAADSIAVGDSLQLSAYVISPSGDTMNVAVEWATTNPAFATVTAGGLVHGVATGQAQIYATYEGVGGFAVITVADSLPPPPPPPDSGAFVWTGAVSSDWSTAGNWSRGAVPGAADSAHVPAGAPNAPALSASSAIGSLTVEAGATVAVGAFDLTVGRSVLANGAINGTTGRVILAGTGTVGGLFPRLTVTGTYGASANVTTSATLRIQGGRLFNAGFRIRVNNF